MSTLTALLGLHRGPFKGLWFGRPYYSPLFGIWKQIILSASNLDNTCRPSTSIHDWGGTPLNFQVYIMQSNNCYVAQPYLHTNKMLLHLFLLKNEKLNNQWEHNNTFLLHEMYLTKDQHILQ